MEPSVAGCVARAWLWPGAAFLAYFCSLTAGFSALDRAQPAWYSAREIPAAEDAGKRAQLGAVWRRVLPVVARNLACSLVFATGLWCLRAWLWPPSVCRAADGSWLPEREARAVLFAMGGALVALFGAFGASEALVVCGFVAGAHLTGPRAESVVSQLLLSYAASQVNFAVNHHLAHRWSLAYHDVHHEFAAPIALCAFYCHWKEMIILNLPVAELGPLLFGLDPLAHTIWLLMAGSYVIADHTGHQLGPTWLFNARYHDLHHRRPGRHHGSLVLDALARTS